MTNFIHLPIDPKEFGRWCGLRGLDDQDLAMHTLVTGLFGRQVLQPFRYYESAHGASIYGYARQTGSELQDMIALTATPDVSKVISGPIAAKQLPALRNGARIGFEIRITPVRRKGSAQRDAHDVDLAMNSGRSREESYQAWFSERMGEAAEIEAFRVAKYARTRTRRNGKTITLSDAVFQGTLSITDAKNFDEILSNGIGRQKSYGYGMLLLRPADPATN